jgi:hypothetical protein
VKLLLQRVRQSGASSRAAGVTILFGLVLTALFAGRVPVLHRSVTPRSKIQSLPKIATSDDSAAQEPASNQPNVDLTLGAIYDPTSTLVAGVNSFDGGSASNRTNGSPNFAATFKAVHRLFHHLEHHHGKGQSISQWLEPEQRGHRRVHQTIGPI